MKTKIKFCVMVSYLALSIHNVYALEVMTEDALAASTGQDGVSIGLNLGANGAITFDHVMIEDRNGIAGTAQNPPSYTSAAGLAYITQNSGTGVQFRAGASALTKPFALVMDVDGNNANPVMNIGIQFDSSLSQIKLNAFSLGLVTINPSNLAINPNSRRDILKTGANGLDILFKSGNPLGINLQLGNAPQGAMFTFSGGSIDKIKTDEPIEILSYANCAAGSPCASNSSLKFGFELAAYNTTGIQLNGLYMDVNNEGLEIGKAGVLDGFGLKLSNVTMGVAGGPNSTIFNNLPNASIGTIGLENIQISGLKMNVKGL